MKVGIRPDGASPSGKAGDFDSPMRRFESSRPSHHAPDHTNAIPRFRCTSEHSADAGCVSFSIMNRNTEERARALCALDIQSAHPEIADVPAAVERLWPVVALEIQNGIVDPEWPIDLADLAQRAEEYRRLKR